MVVLLRLLPAYLLKTGGHGSFEITFIRSVDVRSGDRMFLMKLGDLELSDIELVASFTGS